jgi:hypothetical protein
MQPSDPTPEEREAREVLTHWIRNSATMEHGEPTSHPVSKRRWERDVASGYADLDTYAHAVYQRGVRDAMAVVEAEEEASGPMPDEMWNLLQVAMRMSDRSGAEAVIRGTIAATKKSILRALTPPEPTE